MPKVSNVFLRDIVGSIKETYSILSFDYTVTFTAEDQALGTPYHVYAWIMGDDTNVFGDAPGGSDLLLSGHDLGLVAPAPPVQMLGGNLEMSNDVLNEDSAHGDKNANPDEIRVKIQLKPLKAVEEVWSPESNLRTLVVV